MLKYPEIRTKTLTPTMARDSLQIHPRAPRGWLCSTSVEGKRKVRKLACRMRMRSIARRRRSSKFDARAGERSGVVTRGEAKEFRQEKGYLFAEGEIAFCWRDDEWRLDEPIGG